MDALACSARYPRMAIAGKSLVIKSIRVITEMSAWMIFAPL
jgi:hypothetical protein